MSHREHEALHLEQQHLSLDDKQSCDRCGAPFSPRRSRGGSQQRFCSSDCRMTFHKERQRTRRTTSYAGPTTLPDSGKPTQNETHPREPAVAALHPWETGVIDIANCDRIEFVLALKESEAAGTRVETWPPEVRALMDRRVRCWVEENKTRTVRAMTVAAPKYDGIQSCVVILHCSPKRDAGPGSEDEALHAVPAGGRVVS
jgi:predicted nucleic acid-binding Zn ribbon protein